MNRTNALRRVLLSSGPACAILCRRAGDTDAAIHNALNDPALMALAVAGGHRLSGEEVDRLLAPLVSEDAPATDPGPGDVEHVRFMLKHG